MRESKGGTGRAFMSTGGRTGEQREERSGRAEYQSAALAELTRILSETEPGPRSLAYHDEAEPAARAVGSWRGIPRNLTAHEALAESLAAVTADGGPLDELALDAALNDGGVLAARCYRNNSATDAFPGIREWQRMQADPVILAAQRDLAVLSAYAQGVRA